MEIGIVNNGHGWKACRLMSCNPRAGAEG
ncbi:hypothetical protein CCACVL1_09703 [Corchorus capsularis]|uniref:Uncharacterized protein n=1 Tax=Corchorus capsularis TaxID=210143 RepID=A0A1R3IUI1_COCAP|nr:hypothetical protein CCACVL1_09703 [Corchorus capsularis]